MIRGELLPDFSRIRNCFRGCNFLPASRAEFLFGTQGCAALLTDGYRFMITGGYFACNRSCLGARDCRIRTVGFTVLFHSNSSFRNFPQIQCIPAQLSHCLNKRCEMLFFLVTFNALNKCLVFVCEGCGFFQRSVLLTISITGIILPINIPLYILFVKQNRNYNSYT